MGFKYTKEHLEFLRVGYLKMQKPELTSEFNKKFNLNKSVSNIKSVLNSNGFKCGRHVGSEKGSFRSFTSDQAEFIKEKFKTLSLRELTTEFNKEFESQKTFSQIRCFTKNHGIKSGRSGHYNTGGIPWNKGTKGVCKPNSGSFKKGRMPKEIKPLGHERVCTIDGYILVKIAEPNPYTKSQTRYKAKHVVVWEKENGKAPPGMVVTFKDSNKLNCSLENLIIVSKAEMLYLNQHGYKDLPNELRPSMLAMAKLETMRFKTIKNLSN